MQIQACLQKLPRPSALRPQPSPGGREQLGPALPPGFIQCLPDRFRRFVSQQQVLTQVVAPPQTDINTSSYTVAGVDPATPGIGLVTAAQITQGRFLSADASANEAVLSTAYAQRKDVSVGSTLTINGLSLTVVGLARPPLGGQPADVYMSLKTLQDMSSRPGRSNVILVRADNAANVDRVQREIESAFPGAQVTSSKDVARQVSGSLVDAARLATRLRLVLALVALAAAFPMASLLTLSSVGKRVRELGTLRALGWRKARVVRQIVGESLVQGVFGGLAGIALGVVAALVIIALAQRFRRRPVLCPAPPQDWRRLASVNPPPGRTAWTFACRRRSTS